MCRLAFARFQASLFESIFPALLRKAPPLNRDQLIMLGEDNVGDAQPANELFGLKPVSFREESPVIYDGALRQVSMP